MNKEELSGARVLVIGGTQGLGRGVSEALRGAKATVCVVARNAPANEPHFRRADISKAGELGRVLDDFRPQIVVLTAGAIPFMRPIADTDWESFGVHWHVEVRATFDLIRDAVNKRLEPGARVVVFSSGAALSGSPLSGGYASAKQAQIFLCRYGRTEAAAGEVDVRIQCVLPGLTPHTRLGQGAVASYARHVGVSAEAFAERLSPAVTSEIAGQAVLRLLTEPSLAEVAELRLDGNGLHPVAT